jgi:hypothetical protein
MNIKKFYMLFTVAVISFLFIASFSTKYYTAKNLKVFDSKENYGNKEIIKFNHAKHVKENGMKCNECHPADKSTSADDRFLPEKTVCSGCHDVKSDKECKLCHYDGVFKKLVPVKKEIYFNHKIHIEKNNKTCTDCHKGLDVVKYASDISTSSPDMQVCYKCHNNQSANNNCEFCHSNPSNLKPKTHLVSNFLNEHKFKVNNAPGSEFNDCVMCHSDNFCQACHTPIKYSGNNVPNNFYAPYYTKENGVRTDRAALQRLTNMHQINYQYTHGLDAKQKSYECKTCHDPVSFCASCHQNEGNTLTGVLPKNHLSPDFKTFGVNTGGGLHAILARKNIEDCEACHATNGADPVCVRCHVDGDGVKGTNPKTHELGFMKDEKGIWHDTPGAICYVCHNDYNAKPNGQRGIGFCGYCHGK